MKAIIPLILSILVLTGCATQNAMPLGNDMMQIDVSAAPVYGRTGAQRLAFQKAAQATIEAGYDKFIVVGNEGWNETSMSGGSSGSFNANPQYASGSYNSGFGTMRHPESTMVIKMFHNGDKGSAKAIDARSVLPKK